MKKIGVIRTQYQTPDNMPIQPKGARDSIGEIVLNPEFQAGLLDLDGFSHIYLIYEFHLTKGYQLKVKPFMDDKEHGVFATRAPNRPNPIGLSIVELLSVDRNILKIRGADVVDGTPILDIKPYIEPFDKVEHAKNGWFKAADQEIIRKRSDDRFQKGSR
jgi:tRNA-Thr(GGU) m(6)t(6)A37 methyltransferase TsaA